MRDGVRRVVQIVELSGMEGEIITARDLYTYQHQGEGRDGRLQGSFEPTRLRPDLAIRAAQYGLEKQVLEAVGIGAGAGAGAAE
jgi:pilus assembly protein CpaF